RLNKRSVTLQNQLADMPNASIPRACNGCAEMQAGYGLLAREEIGWEGIVAPCSAVRSSACKAGRWCCASRIQPNLTFMASRRRDGNPQLSSLRGALCPLHSCAFLRMAIFARHQIDHPVK